MDRGDHASWRRPTIDDATAILELITAYNTALVGFGDVTLNDVTDALTEPGFDPATDAWLVEDASGTPVGYGWTADESGADLVHVEVVAADDTIASALWDRVLERAVEMGAAAGHPSVTVDIGIYQTDAEQRDRAHSRGLGPTTTFQRMRIDFDAPPEAPVVPDGVVVLTGPGDETFRRHGHSVSTEAFVEHYGYVKRTFEEWHERIEASSSHDWSQLRVAYVGDEPVAMVRGSDDFVEDHRCGYVTTVAVLPSARGRGLAALLLRQAFVDDFERGRQGTVLHVDSNNVTPAVDLYLRVGMRPVLAIDVWSARLPVG